MVNCLPFFQLRVDTFFKGEFFGYFFMYDIQYCFICRPSDSTVSEDAGIEPRTVATTALAVRSFNHSARSNPPLCQMCCYNKVDSAMAESQNGFCSFKSSIHKKTNFMQIMTKNITICIYLIFYHREIVKLDHFMTLSFYCANTVL